VDSYYETFTNIKKVGLDALIITGANVTQTSLSKEPFWEPLIEVVDWAYENDTSTLCSCLATHAVMEFCYKQKRRPLAYKRWGVFSHTVLEQRHPLVLDVNTQFDVPHSRYNEISRPQLEQAGLAILAESEAGGVHMAVSPNQLRMIYFQGHPEYAAISLLKECKREVFRYVKGEREKTPRTPENFFSDEGESIVAAHIEAVVKAMDSSATVPEFPESELLAHIDNTWGDTGKAIVNNWLGLVYQLTSLDRREQFMPGVDPKNPLLHV